LKLYCTVASDSTPVSVKAGLLVILSELELPVSVVRPTMDGAAGAVVSSVKVNASEAGLTLLSTSI
jgi:hypothetical protein